MLAVFKFLLFASIFAFLMYSCSEREDSPEVKAQKAEEIRIAKQKGFHCLSQWDGTHRRLIADFKPTLRDPASFEHIETKITPVNNGQHTLFMKYRAKNAFGGYVINDLVAKIDHDTCRATVIANN